MTVYFSTLIFVGSPFPIFYAFRPWQLLAGLVEALESYKEEINQGDTISVAADSTKVSDILGTYQEHNSFRIYFPKIDDTSDGISVTCLDVVQYDSSGEIIQQAERQWSECEPVNWKQRIRWNGQYRQISIELVRVS